MLSTCCLLSPINPLKLLHLLMKNLWEVRKLKKHCSSWSQVFFFGNHFSYFGVNFQSQSWKRFVLNILKHEIKINQICKKILTTLLEEKADVDVECFFQVSTSLFGFSIQQNRSVWKFVEWFLFRNITNGPRTFKTVQALLWHLEGNWIVAGWKTIKALHLLRMFCGFLFPHLFYNRSNDLRHQNWWFWWKSCNVCVNFSLHRWFLQSFQLLVQV